MDWIVVSYSRVATGTSRHSACGQSGGQLLHRSGGLYSLLKFEMPLARPGVLMVASGGHPCQLKRASTGSPGGRWSDKSMVGYSRA